MQIVTRLTVLSLLVFSHALYAKPYSCELIKTASSCAIISECSFDITTKECKGTVQILPRFISEFVKESDSAFSIETVLAEADLGELSLHHRSLAKFILEKKIQRPWILKMPNLGLPDMRKAFDLNIEKLGKYGINLENFGDYPFAMNFQEEEAKYIAFSTKFEVPIPELLKLAPDKLDPSFFENSAQKLKFLNLSVKNVLSIEEQNPLSNLRTIVSKTSLKTLQKLTVKLHLSPLEIASIKDPSIIARVDTVIRCIDDHILTWTWISQLEPSVSHSVISDCKKIKELITVLGIPLEQFEPSWELLEGLKDADITEIKKIKDELEVSLDFIVKYYDELSGNKTASIKERMRLFDCTAEDAIHISPTWNSSNQERAKSLAKEFGVEVREIVKIPPEKFDNPKLLSIYKALNLPLSFITRDKQLSNLSHPSAFKELSNMWIAETRDRLRIPFSKIYKISEDPKLMRSFLPDWELYKLFLDFSDFVDFKQEADPWNLQRRVLSRAIERGNLETVKSLPFIEEAGSLLIAVGLSEMPPWAFARLLGYEDIAKFLSQYKSVVRYEVTKGSRERTQCPLKRSEVFLGDRAWYSKCHDYEKSNLVYMRSAGNLIESQIAYWNDKKLSKIEILESKFLGETLEGYKTTEYVAMGEYIGKRREDSFPFTNGKDPGDEINASNFAILLAPKSRFDLTVYRGQKCNASWIRYPHRLLSTSASAALTRNWVREGSGCVIELQIPSGFPLFFLNIASIKWSGEHEFLLPSHVLNKEGKLVPAHYDILNESKSKEYTTTTYDAERDLEIQSHFTVHSYTVKPGSDLMSFDRRKGESFEEYEKRYHDLVCAPENLTSPQNKLLYLKEICAATSFE